jgi:ribokinase
VIRVFGSINLDLVATVDVLPRAGETQRARAFRSTPGGKGANQALAARRAGADVALYGAVGRDAFAAPALSLLREAGVDVSGVAEVDAATGLALIHVDTSGENTVTSTGGANALARQAPIPDAALATGDTLVMQLEVPMPDVAALAARARARGVRVVLNAAPMRALPDALLDCVDVLVVNQHEAAALAAQRALASEPAAFVRAFAGPRRAVVVTLGGAGAVAHDGVRAFAFAPPRVAIVDTVGAGDALVGALGAQLDRGISLHGALPRALAAGALACTRHGAQEAMPCRDEIERLAPSVESRNA